MKRYEIFKKFQKYVQHKDNRPMNEICKSGEAEFALQAQQLFLKEYMQEYPDWKSLLLYHEIGSGKTCTAITMAEEYLRTNPNNKIKVILPARLKTNFIDELISPCGMEVYLSQDDFKKFTDSSTKLAEKNKIKTRFTTAISRKYDIMSFEKFKNNALNSKNIADLNFDTLDETKTEEELKTIIFEKLKLKPKNLKDWIRRFTKNSMIIVDEVHNLLSDKYDVKKSKDIFESGKVTKRIKGMNTILFRLLTMYADPSCKMIFLTATPIFDNITQFQELVKAMNPSAEIKKNSKLSDVIDNLRGKVSYFPGTSINAYPSVKYEYHNIQFSKTQDENTYKVLTEDKDSEDDLLEQFMSKQRQISLACMPNSKILNVDVILGNMNEYCPKIVKMIEVINKEPGKHIVYSNFVKSGLKIVEAALKREGWMNLFEVINDSKKWKESKVYALWDGSVKDKDKQTIKGIVNSKDNIFGDKIKIILGSPSIKEGVSFKHIQHIHLLDPVWNQSAKTQVEGRAIRYCSHVDITDSHKPLKREVVVDIYKSKPRPRGLVEKTCDEIIYDDIIPRKTKLVKAAENALKKVAIDHYLFRNMYSNSKLKTPDSSKSDIELDRHDDVAINMKAKKNKTKNTCPKKRRPNEDGICPENTFKKKNKQGFECCYKVSKSKTVKKENQDKPKCPKNRIPVDGICKDGFVIKKNKQGEDCCYKKYTKK